MTYPDYQPDPWLDLADDIRRDRASETVEVWQARATQAEARVASLEATVERMRRIEDDWVQANVVRMREARRLRGVCEAAAAMLREDRPKAALALLEEAIRV